MVNTKYSPEAVINWALVKIEELDKQTKLYTGAAIFLTILDVFFGTLAVFYAGLVTYAWLGSILSATAWGARAVQIAKVRKLTQSLKLINAGGITYIMLRKKRSEFMKKIKLKNWLVAILNIVAIAATAYTYVYEPTLLTTYLNEIVVAYASLLGVNLAIPVFNDASVSADSIKAKRTAKLQKLDSKKAKIQNSK